MARQHFRIGTNTQTRSRKKLVLISIFILAAALTTTLFFLTRNSENQSSSAQQEDPSLAAGVSDTGGSRQDSKTRTRDQNVENSKNTSEPLTITPRLTQQDGYVAVDVSLSESAEGLCSITFSRSESRPVTRQVAANQNSCTASIPEVEFDRVGQWLLVISFSNDTHAGRVEENVEIR